RHFADDLITTSVAVSKNDLVWLAIHGDDTHPYSAVAFNSIGEQVFSHTSHSRGGRVSMHPYGTLVAIEISGSETILVDCFSKTAVKDIAAYWPIFPHVECISHAREEYTNANHTPMRIP
ncbi:hypothetical protein ADUPG1_004116, partial [Aduncisulcus paluster]